MAGKFAAVAFASALIHYVSASACVPSATLSAGTVYGAHCSQAPNALAFRGIPYAQRPVGHLRFEPPRPYSGSYSDGHLNATTNPPSCIQFGEAFKDAGPTSEDCLYLNIYVPRNATLKSALPIRVWIYGGFNTDGGIADPLYDGCNVAAHDTIMVSVNYRLGPVGFLMLRDAGFTGNQALKDIVLALRWVRENIAAFGGDAEKVMLHGQSAGARDAFTIATLPEAPELFSAAIFESGAGRETTTCSNAQKIGEAYARAVQCDVNDPDRLRSAPIEKLVSQFETLPILNTGSGHFPGLSASSILTADLGPVVDGDFVKVQPSDSGVQVPSVIGYSARDGALFVATSPAFPNPLAISAQNYTAFLTQSFGPTAAALIEQHIPIDAFNATGGPGFAAIEYVFTASEYQCPPYRALNKAVANGVDAWAYVFDHTPSCPWAPGLSRQEVRLLGPTHTAEIPFVLGNTRGLPAPGGNCSFTAVEDRLSEFMLEAWTRMAREQRPGSSDVWPRFGGGNSTRGVTFGEKAMAGKIDFSVCELFDRIRDAQIKVVGETGCYQGKRPHV